VGCSRRKKLGAVLTVSAELCCEGCSRGKKLSAVCTVIVLNCVMWAATERRS